MEQNGMEMEWNERGYIVFIYSVIIARNQLNLQYDICTIA